MMRRRRDQANTRRRTTNLGYKDTLYGPGLSAFARLRALRHLNLDFVRVHQVVGGYAETS